MFQITTSIYSRLASELLDKISSKSIFSGSIEFETDEVDIIFIATIIPYFHREEFSEGEMETIQNIVPVWWELHTTTLDGEVINDFDFETLKFLLCQQ